MIVSSLDGDFIYRRNIAVTLQPIPVVVYLVSLFKLQRLTSIFFRNEKFFTSSCSILRSNAAKKTSFLLGWRYKLLENKSGTVCVN